MHKPSQNFSDTPLPQAQTPNLSLSGNTAKISPSGLNRFLFILVLFLAIAGNCLFFYFDNSVKGVDAPNHLLFSLEFFYSAKDILFDNSINAALKWYNLIVLFSHPVHSGTIYWPNGLNVIASVFYSILGTSLFSARLAILPFLFVLLTATYLLAKLIIPHRFAGGLAVFLVFMYPIIFQSSRCFQLDFPLCAMITLTMLLLLKTEFFTNKKYCILSAFSLGGAMLIKGQAILFIGAPLAYLALKGYGIARKKNALSSFTVNLLLFLIPAFIISWLWWGPSFSDTMQALHSHVFLPGKAREGFTIYPFEKKFSLPILLFYFSALPRAMGHVLLGCFLITALSFFKNKNSFKNTLLLWIAVPFLLFTILFTIKEARFIMPILPAMALITTSGIMAIKNKPAKKILLSAIILFSLIQFLGYSCGRWAINNILIGSPALFPVTSYETIPIKRDIKINQVIAAIRRHLPWPQPVKIGIISGGYLESLEVIYWFKLGDRLMAPSCLLNEPLGFMREFDSFDAIVNIRFIQFEQDRGFRWPDSSLYWKTLQKRSPLRIERVGIADQFPKIISMFEKATNDFTHIATLEKGGYGYDCYTIYIRKDCLKKIDDTEKHGDPLPEAKN